MSTIMVSRSIMIKYVNIFLKVFAKMVIGVITFIRVLRMMNTRIRTIMLFISIRTTTNHNRMFIRKKTTINNKITINSKITTNNRIITSNRIVINNITLTSRKTINKIISSIIITINTIITNSRMITINSKILILILSLTRKNTKSKRKWARKISSKLGFANISKMGSAKKESFASFCIRKKEKLHRK